MFWKLAQIELVFADAMEEFDAGDGNFWSSESLEAEHGRCKQVIGDGPRARRDGRRTTEVRVAVHVSNLMLELGRPVSVRIE
jgi:hypothetical protein